MTDGGPWTVHVRRSSYDPATVRKQLEDLLGAMGEPGDHIRPGASVLLKPNVLGRWAPDSAITTHPEIIRQLASLLISAGCSVSVGDSSGGKAAAHRTEAALRDSGIWEAAVGSGASITNFDGGGITEKTIGDRTYHLAQAAFSHDVLISVPKLKTHSLTMLTAAVKNTYGCVPGLGKVRLHEQNPGAAGFAEVVVDISQAVCPVFSIVDAVTGMDGNGPALGHVIDIGLLFAGRDAFALDMAIAIYTGIDPLIVPTITAAIRRGLGPDRFEQITIDGPTPREADITPFRLPVTARMSSTHLDRIARWVLNRARLVPAVDPGLCVGCGFCADSCPVNAITMVRLKPRFDRKACIDCLCCSELCPHKAVDVRPTTRTGVLLHRLHDGFKSRAARRR